MIFKLSKNSKYFEMLNNMKNGEKASIKIAKLASTLIVQKQDNELVVVDMVTK